jgi:hypothetical protein
MRRLNFLRKKFNIVSDEKYMSALAKAGVVSEIPDSEGIEALRTHKYFQEVNNAIYISEYTFQEIVKTDPTKNKMNVQWLMDMLMGMILSDTSHVKPHVFLREDLPKTRENLELFEGNKRKKRFKEMASKNYALRNIPNPTNINQYNSLDELFAAVYPFKPVVNMSDLEKQMEYFVSIGEGELPVKDEQYTVFIPKTLRASELFSFTNWCTGTKGNTMFKHYTTNNLKPNGDPSDLIIVIDNGFLRGENENIYQIHFETSQIMDKRDNAYSDLRVDIIEKNISVRNFFYETLYNHIKDCYNKEKGSGGTYMFGKDGLSYTKYALKFGFGGILFEVMDDSIPTIAFVDCSIDSVPDLSRFTSVGTLYFDNVNISKLDETFFTSKELKMISIPRNHISKIPASIGNCKKLRFMNLKGNPIGYIPDEIKYLDPSNGGSLEKIAIDDSNPEVVEKLKKLLPSVNIC